MELNSQRRRWPLPNFAVVALTALVLGACGDSTGGIADPARSTIDPTPTKLDGTASHEFEQDDLDAAAAASDAVKDYCSGAVSEAQRLGCESHVTDDELP